MHAAVLLILALIVPEPQPTNVLMTLVATSDLKPQQPLESVEIAVTRPSDRPSDRMELATVVDPSPIMPHPDDPSEVDPRPAGPALPILGVLETPPSDALMISVGLPTGGGLEGRSTAMRAKLGSKYDPGGLGDQAVRRGLRWLAAHQRNDGSWNFNHHDETRCPNLCRNTGSVGTTTGSTAVALLAFLGAGETHQEGEFAERIRRGLYYLSHRAIETPHGADLQEGTMYAHGLATIALCEAYAMTKDQNLRPWAQDTIDFVVYAQDKRGGGWRYTPGEPGDTTVFGWQLMSLKAGNMAGLSVPSLTLHDANRFLDQVQSDEGALYGYQKPGAGHATTAVGLLCRMYQGWPRRYPALQRGVVHLYQWGPSQDDMYYNYYATQVLHHYGGGFFERWHTEMRDLLLRTQAKTGHEAGSWYFDGGHCDVGGRLLSTALATMTLEVYYRHMPLYQDDVMEE